MVFCNRGFCGLALAVGLALVFSGAALRATTDDHPEVGPHNGTLAEWGEEEYHLEFTVDNKTQTVTVYVLDGSAKKAKPIDSKELTLTLKQKPAVTVKLQSSPDAGDPAGKSSRFTAKNPAFAADHAFAGTISGKVGNKPYSGDFKEKARKPK